jgi:uroporphyrinogen-III decarboxylase
MLSPEDFALLWVDAPEVMVEMTAIAARRLNACVERLCQEGVDAFRIVGGEYVTCQLGPRAFEALIRPFDTELCHVLRRYGAVAYYHNHGPIMRWLEPIADLGVDALDPLEAPPWGDGDLREARRRIGDRVCLVGNLDDMEVLEQWDEESVKGLGRRRIEEAGTTGFILGGTASGTYCERAARNFMALVEVAEHARGG